jgi:hypothetical protein
MTVRIVQIENARQRYYKYSRTHFPGGVDRFDWRRWCEWRDARIRYFDAAIETEIRILQQLAKEKDE